MSEVVVDYINDVLGEILDNSYVVHKFNLGDLYSFNVYRADACDFSLGVHIIYTGNTNMLEISYTYTDHVNLSINDPEFKIKLLAFIDAMPPNIP